MVLIISDEHDTSTNEVIDWLDYFHVKWQRINNSDPCELSLVNSKIYLKFKKTNINVDEINVVWYRRGFISLAELRITKIPKFNSYLRQNKNTLHEYLQYKLSKKKQINCFNKADVNKLIVNEIAKDIGLKIPNSYISKSILAEENYEKAITKPITPSFFSTIDDISIDSYTKILNKENVKSFNTSLIQEYIEKKYEIRTFYLLGKCWSMAIFSQGDAKTQIDFRRYNNDLPNRNIPFNLPKKLEKKIHLLMKALSLESGSIDFLYSTNDEFYFLEVNPVGQFDMVSFPCNYHLEKEIALQLKNNNYEK